MPGHEYLNVFSPDVCPGAPGSGPYLGLCANDPNMLIAQAVLPTGVEPFHFTAYDRRRTFGPFQAQPGLTIDGICVDVTGGTLGCASAVSRVALQ